MCLRNVQIPFHICGQRYIQLSLSYVPSANLAGFFNCEIQIFGGLSTFTYKKEKIHHGPNKFKATLLYLHIQ